MHLGICALLLACGGEDVTAPSDTVPPTPPPPTFTLVGQGIPTHQLTSDLWVHGTVAYTGMEDVDGTGTAANTLLVWDVSNPATPVLASSLVVDGVGSVVDVMIRADGTLGVIAHEGDGITLLDLSNPLSPQVITRFFNADGLPVLAHNIWIEGDYVYATEGAGLGEGGRLSIIDISNPADPQVVAVFYAGSDSANDVYVRDGLAFVSQGNAGLVIVDVGNGIAGGSPTNLVEVGRVQILNFPRTLFGGRRSRSTTPGTGRTRGMCSSVTVCRCGSTWWTSAICPTRSRSGPSLFHRILSIRNAPAQLLAG